jgi:hypothetical protein
MDVLSSVVGPRFLLSLGSSPVVDHHSRAMLVKANRCSGKTQLLCTLAARLAIQNHYKVCIVFSCEHLALNAMARVAQLLPDAQTTNNRVHPSFGGGWVHCGKQVVNDADVFLVDELGYMDPNVFYEDLAPKLCMDKPIMMLLIGTPTGNAQNLMARLCRLNVKQDGIHHSLVNVIDVTTEGERRPLL